MATKNSWGGSRGGGRPKGKVTDNEAVSITFPRKILEKLKLDAEIEGISLSAYVIKVMYPGLKARGYQAPGGS